MAARDALCAKPDGTEGTKAFTKKIDASTHAATQEVEARRGLPNIDPQRTAITVRKYGESVFMPAMLGVSAHIERYGPGPDGVIITNRVGKVARRNSFGFCWRNAVVDARTCGKPPLRRSQRRVRRDHVRRPEAGRSASRNRPARSQRAGGTTRQLQ